MTIFSVHMKKGKYLHGKNVTNERVVCQQITMNQSACRIQANFSGEEENARGLRYTLGRQELMALP
jgi:hypothetical protein